MHKVKEMVDKEIHAIEEKGITRANLPVLGELVDIRKDICNIEYWNHKMHGSSNADVLSSVNSEIGDLMYAAERARNSGMAEDKSKVDEHAKRLVEAAENIRMALTNVDVSSSVAAKVKALFK